MRVRASYVQKIISMKCQIELLSDKLYLLRKTFQILTKFTIKKLSKVIKNISKLKISHCHQKNRHSNIKNNKIIKKRIYTNYLQ